MLKFRAGAIQKSRVAFCLANRFNVAVGLFSNHRWRQNVVRTKSDTRSSYHILMVPVTQINRTTSTWNIFIPQKTLNVVDFTVISTHVLQKIIVRTNRNAPKNSADHIQNNCASFNQVGTRWFVEEMKNCGKWKENWVLLKPYLSLLPLETATNKNWEIFEGVIALLYFKIWKSSGKKHHCAWYFW